MLSVLKGTLQMSYHRLTVCDHSIVKLGVFGTAPSQRTDAIARAGSLRVTSRFCTRAPPRTPLCKQILPWSFRKDVTPGRPLSRVTGLADLAGGEESSGVSARRLSEPARSPVEGHSPNG